MYWEPLHIYDKREGNLIDTKYRCAECGYIVNKIFPKKWWINPAYPWPHIVHMEKFVEECPNCHEKITLQEYINKSIEIHEKELEKLGRDIQDICLELMTQKTIQSEQKYI